MESQLKPLAERLKALGDALDDIDCQKKLLNKEYDDVSADLLQIMNAMGMTNFKTEFGTFYINTSRFPKIVDQVKAFAYLRELGAGDIIKETVNSMTLRKTYSELEEAGTLDIFAAEANGIVAHTEESVRMRKAS